MVDGKKKNIIVDITDEEELYSGCWVYASVNFYPFNASGNKVACFFGFFSKHFYDFCTFCV